MNEKTESVLGINGLGRIGKLTLWHHIARKYFREIVVNIGREAGNSLSDIARYIVRDSTYVSLPMYLYGCRGGDIVSDVDDSKGTMTIDGIKVTILRKSRNPKALDWRGHNVGPVIDATGRFRDPALSADEPGGSLRGHLEAGAERVILSAPFKIKDKTGSIPDDAVTCVKGINEHDYNPSRHKIVSAASCTTTCLGHMMKPLLDVIGAKRILTASMATVHAATGSQQVLDRLAGPGAKDLRKNRSILNNIILTTTGAADTLALVLPQMRQIGFMAESVRVPITTGSLIILTVNIQEDESKSSINRQVINDIYRQAAASPNGYLVYTDEQNVSCDIIAMPKAATIIEGHETHTRTAEVSIDVERLAGIKKEHMEALKDTEVSIPLTQAVIYGWYDNEMGNYVNMLGELTCYIAESGQDI
ncbi:MAG TPA: glyceraldehyde-3-phosphate dehydrogenase [Nitrospirae bacterium]|nr:glyceraldehyde-3-phosphate dehydrogenase [bacterium BMS3Abin06]HDH13169.1 glyceraldehyde-3-phosphate dehydrogenase [Nitrospirota bacterium]HDZ01863.1 glyceraldehyde-3-phosphate dehydrogenase [Nitrospirota bacterium]